MTETKQGRNEMLDSFIDEFHTDGQGSIMIDDSEVTLRMTIDLIKDDASTDYDCMISEVIESDEAESLCQSMISGREDDQLKCLADLKAFSDKIKVETIDRLLRAR